MINKMYVSPEILEEINNAFNNSKPKMIRLDNFLEINFCNRLIKYLDESVWKKTKLPDRYSFSETDIKDFDYLRNFLGEVVGKKTKNFQVKFRKYEWKDYHLIHDSEEFEGTEFCIFLIREVWDPEMGGSFVYKSEKDYIFNPVQNSFFMFEKKKNILRFVKYLNNSCRDKKIYTIQGYVT